MKKTQEQIIGNFIRVHGDRYDYSMVEYINVKTKVKIICKHHGVFEQTPNNHTTGYGCMACGNKAISEFILLSTEEFIRRVNKKHNYKYDYSNSSYINAHTKVEIKCPFHGSFDQTPGNHLYGQGCTKCAREDRGLRCRLTNDEFIEKAKELHKDLYIYSKSNYVKSNQKIIIICKIHGEFLQTPNSHLSGAGCNKCNYYSNYRKQDYIKKAKGREACVYIIRCWNEEEEFYKIGRTYTNLNKRYSGNQLPYHWEVIEQIFGNAGEIFDLENELLKMYNSYKYTPKIPFGGETECVNINTIFTHNKTSL